MILLLFLSVVLFVCFLDTLGPKRSDSLAPALIGTTPARVLILNTERLAHTEKGQTAYQYIAIVKRKNRNGRWGASEIVSIDQLQYAEMRQDMEANLFFDKSGNCVGFEPALEHAFASQ